MTCEQLAYDDDAQNLVFRAFSTLVQRHEIRVTIALGTRLPCRMNVQSHYFFNADVAVTISYLHPTRFHSALTERHFKTSNTGDENGLFGPFDSRAKAPPGKRWEKGYGDENGAYVSRFPPWQRMRASFMTMIETLRIYATGKFAENSICSPAENSIPRK